MSVSRKEHGSDGFRSPTEKGTSSEPLFAKLQRFAARFGVEQRGIEPVPSDERSNPGMPQIGTMWFSANLVVSTFALGAIAIPLACSRYLGPIFGHRQMVLSQYYFGYHGVKLGLAAAINVIGCIGWSAVNVTVGAQLFPAVNKDIAGWASILIISMSALIVSLLAYNVLHAYERWAWAPAWVVFTVTLGQFAHSGKFDSLLPLSTGQTEAGSILSFASAPVSRSRPHLFVWTFVGLYTPLLFTQLLGAAIMTATVHNEDYLDAYTDSSVGGILAQVLVPPLGRFGEFCLAILALSIIANNCPNIYSISFALLGTLCYVAIAIPGYDSFTTWLEKFMLIISYWLGIYLAIALLEHLVFRRGIGGYRADDYMNPKALPPGFAAIAAFGFGVMGACLGMSQAWSLAFGFTGISFTTLRELERGYFKR
ncbi:purine-cytosine permease [Lasiosphaeria hispida]|uniref:Purine-cytosine permease n=1 Tax=Lasiosphaeria hispida TaxID=260671 RepID=A0AAJ0M891_9PEZI|nr:purine-cytosine permease [Lasiosphaeria hispida]